MVESGELSAGQLAELVGCAKRTVQDWFKKGCPHRLTERKGQEARVSTEAEVRAWCKTQGIRGLNESTERKAQGTQSTGPVELFATTAGTLADFERRVEAEVGRRIDARLAELLDDPDYDQRIIDCRRVIGQITRATNDRIFEGTEALQASQILKNLSAELRMLEQSALEYRARRGDLIERRSMSRAIGGLTDVIVNAMDGVPTAASRESRAEFEKVPGIDHARAEAMARIVATTVDKVVSEARVRISEALEREKERDSEGGATA